EPLAIGVPGDRDVDIKRLEAQVSPAEVVPFSETDFAAYPALAKGYVGPGALGAGSTTGTGAGRATDAGTRSATGSTAGTATDAGTGAGTGIRYLVDPRIATG